MNEPLPVIMPLAQLRADLSLLGTLAKPKRGYGLPVLNAVQFGGGRIAATNLDCSAERPCPEFDGPVWGVEFAPLAELAKAADKGTLVIITPPTAEDAGATVAATVQGSPMSRDAMFFAGEELPPLQPSEIMFAGSAQLFDAFGIAQIRRASNFASCDENRAMLNGVCLDTRQKDGRIVATDGRRLFQSKAFNWVNLPQDECFILPRHPIWHAAQLDGPWLLRTCSIEPPRRAIEVRAGAWRIYAKNMEGNFPNWRQVMPKDSAGNNFTAYLDWREAANLPAWIKALPPGKDGHTSLQITGHGQLEFTHVASGAHRQLDARAEGRHVTANFNGAFIAQLCALGFRSWELVDTLTPLVARSDAGDTVIVMPLRIEEPTAAATPAEAAPAAQPEPAAA